MALIHCPECGQEVSDRAAQCPRCAFPLQGVRTDGVVKIKLPTTQKLGMSPLIATKKARAVWIQDEHGNALWRGELGEVASFSIDAPKRVTVYFGRYIDPVSGQIAANKKYQLAQQAGIHWNAQFKLNEVDVIDSD